MDEQPAILPTEKELPKIGDPFFIKKKFFLTLSVMLIVVGGLVIISIAH